MLTDLTRACAGILILTVACSSDPTTAISVAGSGAGGVGLASAGSTSTGASAAGAAAAPAASGGSGGAATPAAGGGAGANVGKAGSGAGGNGTAGTAANGGGGRGVSTAGSGASGTGSAGAAGASGSGGPVSTTHFSFFVTSYAAMQRLSGSPNGFGGDLRFGKADGLSGADEICRQIAETSLPGAGTKAWRAFLSVTKGSDGKPVNAIDRVGQGPWYDRLERLVAMTKADLAQERPKGADSTIINDLPNEDGVPNHAPDGTQVDNHDILTGSSSTGTLYNSNWSVTCHDWTSSVGSDGKPRVGHAWPRMGGGGGGPGGGGGGGGMNNWMSALDEAGCAAGASLVEMGGPIASNPTVGSGGGYGGIYCFALTP